jgi:hypothetical protein
MIEFKWFPGLSRSQAQKSINSLHEAARKILGVDNILEISSKSLDEKGVRLSAFNLMIKTVKYEKEFSLECAFQSSKVFEKGGPYTDLLSARPIDAKRDERLKNSGRLLYFKFFGEKWDLIPRTAFYDWLYVNALNKNSELAEYVAQQEAFSDIAFNPDRSINCQGYAAALYSSLRSRNLITPGSPIGKSLFLEILSSSDESSTRKDVTKHGELDI